MLEEIVFTATGFSFAVTVGLFVSLGLSIIDLRQDLEKEFAQTCSQDTPNICKKG